MNEMDFPKTPRAFEMFYRHRFVTLAMWTVPLSLFAIFLLGGMIYEISLFFFPSKMSNVPSILRWLLPIILYTIILYISKPIGIFLPTGGQEDPRLSTYMISWIGYYGLKTIAIGAVLLCLFVVGFLTIPFALELFEETEREYGPGLSRFPIAVLMFVLSIIGTVIGGSAGYDIAFELFDPSLKKAKSLEWEVLTSGYRELDQSDKACCFDLAIASLQHAPSCLSTRLQDGLLKFLGRANPELPTRTSEAVLSFLLKAGYTSSAVSAAKLLKKMDPSRFTQQMVKRLSKFHNTIEKETPRWKCRKDLGQEGQSILLLDSLLNEICKHLEVSN